MRHKLKPEEVEIARENIKRIQTRAAEAYAVKPDNVHVPVLTKISQAQIQVGSSEDTKEEDRVSEDAIVIRMLNIEQEQSVLILPKDHFRSLSLTIALEDMLSDESLTKDMPDDVKRILVALYDARCAAFSDDGKPANDFDDGLYNGALIHPASSSIH